MRPGELCRTVQESELFGTVPSPAQFGSEAHSQYWRGFQARFYDNGTVPESNCAEALHSLQVIDLKGKNELCNCAPLKGEEKAAQFGFSLPFEVPGEVGKCFTPGDELLQQTAPAADSDPT
ncbi:hypothetical protein [Aromatoleum aromaticum]|uniref:hypothetical protein n=1 Tax=Aromatoleum aromaticum TaxID=551760 RepID=UPI0013895BD9|nr:hypothetical protein [Aromatoleum aromaticum]